MKILLTGATGYIGKRLIPLLINNGHQVICAVRDISRADKRYIDNPNVQYVKADFLQMTSLENIPKDIELAYYLIHSMSNSSTDFNALEKECALNFRRYMELTKINQVIYLSGITNDLKLSKHLSSRKQVEETLSSDRYALTTLKAGIIVGSGSSSFEIIRDLVEKLPVMIAPKWLNTRTQPISVRDVLTYLINAAGEEKVYSKSFDICGPEVLTYKDMLMQFAEIRGLKRLIITVPVMTPRLSSYWLYFVTSTSYKLARSLVDSMGTEIIGEPSTINTILKVEPITYKEAVRSAFIKIEQNGIVSSWKDSFISGSLEHMAHEYVNVPSYGCYKDHKEREISDASKVINKVWSIGGNTGWYYGTFWWRLRGYMDKFFGGIGLRRGRTNPHELKVGDALDFWRVIYADKEKKKLLLYAEMKLPGEAWLEFKIKENKLFQTATFRPKGLAGRLYWYLVTPFHWIVFNGMVNALAKA